jgi:hypothetical protein
MHGCSGLPGLTETRGEEKVQHCITIYDSGLPGKEIEL